MWGSVMAFAGAYYASRAYYPHAFRMIDYELQAGWEPLHAEALRTTGVAPVGAQVTGFAMGTPTSTQPIGSARNPFAGGVGADPFSNNRHTVARGGGSFHLGLVAIASMFSAWRNTPGVAQHPLAASGGP